MPHASPSGGRDHARQLRTSLGTDRLAPGAGAAALATSPRTQRWALRHLTGAVGAPLSPQALKIVRPAICAGVHEFTLLVAGQGCVDPPAAQYFARLGRPEVRARLGATTPEHLTAAVDAAIRHQVDQDLVLQSQADALLGCLDRYVAHLRAAVQGRAGRHPRPGDLDPTRVPDDVAPYLYYELAQHFGHSIHQVYVTVQAATDQAAGDSIATVESTTSSPAVTLRARDHLVFLHPTAFPRVAADLPDLGPLTVHAGPVSPDELVDTYESALLVARMARLGWIHPPGPVTWQPPTPLDLAAHLPLGLLEQLTPYLRPLLNTPLPLRLEMARSFHRVLAHSSSTLKEHARALNISISTLRHHLVPLEPVQHEPSSTKLVALASVLPDLARLWTVELSHHTRVKRRPDRSSAGPDDAVTPPTGV